MDDEKKVLIKRTESSIEITVGEKDSPRDTDSESSPIPEKEDSEDICPGCTKALENSCCFKPLSKLQLCILAIIAIVTLILALFVIIILVGVIASHGQRLRDLEIKTQILEASYVQFQILAKDLRKNETDFKREMRATIDGAMNQFNIIYIETLSLFSMKDQLENKVDQLINRTDDFEERLELLSNQMQELQPNNTVETLSNSMQLAIEEDQGDQNNHDDLDIQDHTDSSDEGPENECNCDAVVLCMKFTERSNFLCARSMSNVEFQEMKYKYLDELELEYHCHCDNS